MRVLGKDLVELQRPDAERLVERELRAEDMAAEAAEMRRRRSLLEAGALLEQVGDAVDRQQRGDASAPCTTTPAMAISTMRSRCVGERLVTKVEQHQRARP